MPISSDYLDTVTDALRGMGVDTIDVVGLAYFSPPVELPRPDDFPGVGYLELEDLQACLDQFNAAGDAPIDAIADSFLQTSVRNVRQWCQTCVQLQRGLVSFYH
jgi:hypothetical protein